jgi:cystathionine gamma-lyase
VSYLPLNNATEIETHLRPETRMIWLESPSNPLLKLVDLAGVAGIARKHGILTVADNTFATPWAQRPLEMGVDIVLHSATKYLNGHSDVIAGAVVVQDAALAERIGYLQNALGSILSPFDSYLVLRGLKTLALRMRAHAENALAVAHFLEARKEVLRVFHPALPSHPQFELAQRQMAAGSGMVTFQLDADLAAATRFLQALRVFTLAESLGGVESLADHPALMTHASVPPAVRTELGIEDGLIRLSVGVEDIGDLLADLEAAFCAL